jgi:hypothetical protein
MSFDAYKIAVVLRLADKVTPGLVGIMQGLKKTDAEVQALHKNLGLIGTAMMASGTAQCRWMKATG